MSTDPRIPTDDPVFARLEDQLGYYGKRSRSARKAFKFIKVTEIIAAALIPFLTARPWQGMNYLIGGLGVLITILEGLLHLNQYQENWTTYRATAESLKHEKFLFLAKAGPYAGLADPNLALAERVEALVSQENSQWMVSAQKAGQGNQSK